MARYQLNPVHCDRERWLKQYYFVRAAFSVAWVAAAFAAGASSPVIAGALLVLYPAWDAAANFADALRSGHLAGAACDVFQMEPDPSPRLSGNTSPPACTRTERSGVWHPQPPDATSVST